MDSNEMLNGFVMKTQLAECAGQQYSGCHNLSALQVW